jgi:peptidyl-prolyl cis-trans isomerase D
MISGPSLAGHKAVTPSTQIGENTMLRGLRQASSGPVGKAIMSVVVGGLVVAFGIWGIADIFRGFGVTTVAKVGRSEISIDEFRMRYSEQMQQVGRQIGRPLSSEQARDLGLDQQLLGQMIAFAALDERARQLGLGISDADIVRRITSDPAFKGFNGQFDRNLFLQRLRDSGFSEQRFVFEQRQGTLRRQIIDAVGAEITPPQAAALALERYGGEERGIDYVTLDASKAGDIPAPSPEALSAYFEAHKLAFRAPEYRKVLLMAVSQEDLAKGIEVSEDDAKRAYDDHLSRYSTPERREVQQIVFPNAEEAKQASERLAGGLSFEDLAKERNLTDKDIDLGKVAKADIIDPAVANAAFSSPEGGVSSPVAGRFGPAIVRTVKIEPGSTQPFTEVEGDIKHEIALDRAKAEVNKVRDQVEEEFGGGAQLDMIAEKLKIPLVTIDAVDRSGRNPQDQPVTGLPMGVDLINSAFATEVGAENDPLTPPGGGFVWYDVANITPSRERTLDEIKDRVEARWRDDEIVKRLDAKTMEIMDKLKSGTSLADIAQAEDVKIESKSGLKRQASDAGLPERVISQVFRTARDGFGSAEGDKATDRIIFRVADVKVPTFDPNAPNAKTMTDRLKAAYNDELLTQYVTRLESDIGTSVNQDGLIQATGRAPQ